MSGINREIFLDPKHIAKHLPGTGPSNRLLMRGRAAHVFKQQFQIQNLALLIHGMRTRFLERFSGT
jgi:hypothetical protein